MAWEPLKRAEEPKNAEIGEVLRRLLAREATDPVDPRLEFPQNACTFAFGELRGPLPVGALRILWAEGFPFVQPCPDCGELLRMISFGGLLTYGGGSLVCPGCDGEFFQWVGGMSRVGQLLNATRLRGTPFRPTSMFFGAAAGSDGRALLEQLGLPPRPLEEEGVQVSLKNGERIFMELNADGTPVKRSVN